ncbi:alpha-1,4-glucan--maltose-1-phosphate maltosyltransferase [Brevibacterium litoralis]|uniref:alpha-1,4-glucan--maltose-1-phosphate maltosyltransferase n=1 Tax=Brevibacterium litoralis TaxID=3138935 RepID=UPI0032EBF6A6
MSGMAGYYSRIPVVDPQPQVENGAFPAKAIPGQDVPVSALVFKEGHDVLGANAVLYDPRGKKVHRSLLFNTVEDQDRYQGFVTPEVAGRHTIVIEGWVDEFRTWAHKAEVKLAAGADEDLMLAEGRALLAEHLKKTKPAGRGKELLQDAIDHLGGDEAGAVSDGQGASTAGDDRTALDRFHAAVTPELREFFKRSPKRGLVSASKTLALLVERTGAGNAAWYEFFPRSEGARRDPETGEWTSGTFRTAADSLQRVADMGFDVVYLPPVHPIGRTNRKGPNNTLTAGPADPGSPWAVGAAEGGHDAIHPDLGDFADFDAFVSRAHDLGLEVALDLALQASPDHPWAKDHPEWFTTQLDGTIAYAENPPKKYQDIYPINFDNDYKGLRKEVLRIVELWISHGVTIFRVDNPHTKPLKFWEWLIRKVNATHPDVVFLAEAFTRPAMMQSLAKAGFQQSYSYFTWRNTKEEIEEYLTELSTETHPFLRPNFFVNTPDILTEYLQFGGPAAFRIRAVLAATSSPLWGMYAGFELFEHVARPGAEEYIDNEKYEYKDRDFDTALAEGRSLAPFITRLNEIRGAHPALSEITNITFHAVTDDHLVVYSKRKGDDVVLVVLTTDPLGTREATVTLDLAALRPFDPHREPAPDHPTAAQVAAAEAAGTHPSTVAWDGGSIDGQGASAGSVEDDTFTVHDLLTGEEWTWGRENYVRLDPRERPAHVFHVRREG